LSEWLTALTHPVTAELMPESESIKL